MKKQKITQQNQIHTILHVISLLALLVMAAFIYSIHYRLDVVDRSTIQTDRLLQSQITNLRQCMHANDHSTECTNVIHDIDN